MAARKSTRATKKKKSSGWIIRLFGNIDPEYWKKLTRRTSRLLALIIMIAAAVAGLRYLENYVQNITRQRQVQLTLDMANPPRWAGEELIKQICLSSEVKSDDFLLDEALTEKWAQNLRNNPWVKKVNQVRKRFDGRVVIDCELREPIALVQQRGRAYYVDFDGVVLPQMPIYTHVVKLIGGQSPVPAPGESIQSESLLAGLHVLALIREVDRQLPRQERLWGQLARIDVANHEGRLSKANSHLILYTKNNTEIRWGAAVGRERPYYEAPVKYKLARLYQAFKNFGSLDEYSYVELRDLRKEKTDPLRQG